MTIYITVANNRPAGNRRLFYLGESKSWLSLCSSHSNALALDGFF